MYETYVDGSEAQAYTARVENFSGGDKVLGHFKLAGRMTCKLVI